MRISVQNAIVRVDWEINGFNVLWNAVDPKPIESEVVHPFNGLALRVRATMKNDSKNKRISMDLRIVERTSLNSNWSFHSRFGALQLTGNYNDAIYGEQHFQFTVISTYLYAY